MYISLLRTLMIRVGKKLNSYSLFCIKYLSMFVGYRKEF